MIPGLICWGVAALSFVVFGAVLLCKAQKRRTDAIAAIKTGTLIKKGVRE